MEYSDYGVLPLMFMCLNIGRIDEVIYEYFYVVLV